MKEETKQQLIELGFETLEGLAEDAIHKLFTAIELIVKDSDNKIDDMILTVLPKIKSILLNWADSIDKTDNK